MPQSLSMYLGVDASSFLDRGALDPVLDLDTRLFIDPHLLKHCDIEEFSGSYARLQKHFRRIAKLLVSSESQADVFWRKADAMMQWPEVKGLCIGYSKEGTSGSGVGPELRGRLLKTAKEIISKGKDDPELFELVGLFEADFGADRISDMVANVIREDLGRFSRRIYSEIREIGARDVAFDENCGLPLNPYTGSPILLVPLRILRDLPVALDWSSRDLIAQHNEELRQRVNAEIGNSWKQAIKDLNKRDLKKYVLDNPELIDDLVAQYSSKEAEPYDFLEDRAGEYIWFPVTRRFVSNHPLPITLPAHPSLDEVERMVLAICDRFKDLVENNGLCDLFYNKDESPKHESAIQLVFYGIADAYCAANNIMIARESNSGRGPVDFKFGTNMENSVLVEVKKSTNTSGLKKGIEKQLPEYMGSEGSKRAIYLVVNVGYTKAAIDRLNKLARMIDGKSIRIMHVDGIPKASASKL